MSKVSDTHSINIRGPFVNNKSLLKSFSASTLLAQALARSSPRRPRGEKKPIPEEQKDQRYYERRKRNNLAAKKSRDQRKMREDAIGMFNGMFFSQSLKKSTDSKLIIIFGIFYGL